MNARLIALALCTVSVTRVLADQLVPDDPKQAERLAALGAISKTFDVMRDPRSMEISSVLANSTSKRVVGCLEFRSRNGFGGMNVGYSTWLFERSGRFTFTTDKPATWNKYCAKQPMNDYTALGKQLLERMNAH